MSSSINSRNAAIPMSLRNIGQSLKADLRQAASALKQQAPAMLESMKDRFAAQSHQFRCGTGQADGPKGAMQAVANGLEQRRLENFSEGLSVVSQNMPFLDSYRGRAADGVVTMATLRQVAKDASVSPELRRAAQTMVDNPALLAELDTAAGGAKNGKFNNANISAMQSTISSRLDTLDNGQPRPGAVTFEPVMPGHGTGTPATGSPGTPDAPTKPDAGGTVSNNPTSTAKKPSFDDALQTVADHFGAVDDVTKQKIPLFFGGGLQVRDGKASTADLFAITEDKKQPQALRDAAQVLLDNPGKFKQMETRLNKNQDQTFTLNDIKTYLADRKDSALIKQIKADPAQAREMKGNLQTLMKHFDKLDGANSFLHLRDGLFNKNDLKSMLTDNDPSVRKAAMYFLKNDNAQIFSALDTGARIGGKDGVVGKVDIQALLNKLG